MTPRSTLHNKVTKALIDTCMKPAVPAYPIKLPARLVVASVMHKFARVSVAAEACLLVIFADVRLVIKAHSHAHIAGSTQWAMQACKTLSFFITYSKWEDSIFSAALKRYPLEFSALTASESRAKLCETGAVPRLDCKGRLALQGCTRREPYLNPSRCL